MIFEYQVMVQNGQVYIVSMGIIDESTDFLFFNLCFFEGF